MSIPYYSPAGQHQDHWAGYQPVQLYQSTEIDDMLQNGLKHTIPRDTPLESSLEYTLGYPLGYSPQVNATGNLLEGSQPAPFALPGKQYELLDPVQPQPAVNTPDNYSQDTPPHEHFDPFLQRKVNTTCWVDGCETFCLKNIDFVNHLRMHSSAQLHHTGRRYFCDRNDCYYSIIGFNSRDNRTRHIRAMHEKSASSSCQYCSKLFLRRDSVLRHLKKKSCFKPGSKIKNKSP